MSGATNTHKVDASKVRVLGREILATIPQIHAVQEALAQICEQIMKQMQGLDPTDATSVEFERLACQFLKAQTEVGGSLTLLILGQQLSSLGTGAAGALQERCQVLAAMARAGSN